MCVRGYQKTCLAGMGPIHRAIVGNKAATEAEATNTIMSLTRGIAITVSLVSTVCRPGAYASSFAYIFSFSSYYNPVVWVLLLQVFKETEL